MRLSAPLNLSRKARFTGSPPLREGLVGLLQAYRAIARNGKDIMTLQGSSVSTSFPAQVQYRCSSTCYRLKA